MADVEMNLYDLNKQIMNTRDPLTSEEVKNEMAGIAAWFSYETDKYFMLLCHERRDYTLFNFLGAGKKIYEGSLDLRETLECRGLILDIAYEKGVYSIWMRIDGESHLYHLFPYDLGVVEI